MESAASLPPGVFRLRASPRRQPAQFPLGLGASGVHELCEAQYGDFTALTGFALAAAETRPGAVVWISQADLVQAHGMRLQAGLAQARTQANAMLHVHARKQGEALWAVEEALSSSAPGLVIAELCDLDFTASRRLTLAASRHGVPLILLLPYTRDGATAAQARWRISPRPSASNRFDPHAPGFVRWRAVLERARQAPHLAGQVFDLEWNDETLSLTVVPGLAAHAPAPGTPGTEDRERPARRRAG